jgi:hypothetical protein
MVIDDTVSFHLKPTSQDVRECGALCMFGGITMRPTAADSSRIMGNSKVIQPFGACGFGLQVGCPGPEVPIWEVSTAALEVRNSSIGAIQD